MCDEQISPVLDFLLAGIGVLPESAQAEGVL